MTFHLGIALGLALVLSALAALDGPRRAGMLPEVVVANFSFGLGFGLLVPMLAG